MSTPDDLTTPAPYRVTHRRPRNAETVTLTLRPRAQRLAAWRPGQFTMIYAPGVGEVPISISGGDDDEIQLTVRAVGATTRAICGAPIGATLGLRGPFGSGWPDLNGADVLVVAGGIGLAPVRPVITRALEGPGRLTVAIGARTPTDLIFADEFGAWRTAGARVLVTVDRAVPTTGPAWTGHVGVVTTLLDSVALTPSHTVAVVCGPELMMRLTADALLRRGLPAGQIWISLERDMRCGAAVCGHCQLGPRLLCRDGPVVTYADAAPLLVPREL